MDREDVEPSEPAKDSADRPSERVVGVIQARMGSSRLPGKVLAVIGALPLIEWTIAAMRDVPSITELVVATTEEPADDELVAALATTVAVRRGPTFDVLTRCWEAIEPYAPTIVVRQTADNPFVDPTVVEAQIARLRHGFDFVGNTGWPLGIAAEVATAKALAEAYREARDPAEREHVMPFLYARPERYRLGTAAAPAQLKHHRYTVDTDADLELARTIASRLRHGPPTHLAELDAIVGNDPRLAALNAAVRQKSWREVDARSTSD
jgi:spore coat polysaccharide biosynthesis protein SpsF